MHTVLKVSINNEQRTEMKLPLHIVHCMNFYVSALYELYYCYIIGMIAVTSELFHRTFYRVLSS